MNFFLKDCFGMEFKLAHASWCYRKRWHHLPYL